MWVPLSHPSCRKKWPASLSVPRLAEAVQCTVVKCTACIIRPDENKFEEEILPRWNAMYLSLYQRKVRSGLLDCSPADCSCTYVAHAGRVTLRCSIPAVTDSSHYIPPSRPCGNRHEDLAVKGAARACFGPRQVHGMKALSLG